MIEPTIEMELKQVLISFISAQNDRLVRELQTLTVFWHFCKHLTKYLYLIPQHFE